VISELTESLTSSVLAKGCLEVLRAPWGVPSFGISWLRINSKKINILTHNGKKSGESE